VKAEFVRFLLPLTVLLLGGVLEEALPKVLSVGFPVLMTAALVLGVVRTRTEAVLLAVFAGVLEDSLCALPLAMTASFLVVVTLCAWALPVARLAPVVAYPVYQLWLVVWTSLPAGELWGRLLVSVPISALTVAVLRPLLLAFERRLSSDAR